MAVGVDTDSEPRAEGILLAKLVWFSMEQEVGQESLGF